MIETIRNQQTYKGVIFFYFKIAMNFAYFNIFISVHQNLNIFMYIKHNFLNMQK